MYIYICVYLASMCCTCKLYAIPIVEGSSPPRECNDMFSQNK